MENAVIRAAGLSDAERLSEIYRHYVLHTAVTFECNAPTFAFRG